MLKRIDMVSVCFFLISSLYYISSLIGIFYEIVVFLSLIIFFFFIKTVSRDKYSLLLIMYIVFNICVYLRTIFFYDNLIINHSFIIVIFNLIIILFTYNNIRYLKSILVGVSVGSILNSFVMIIFVINENDFLRLSGGKGEVNATALLQIVGIWALIELNKYLKLRYNILIFILLFLQIISVLFTGSRGGFLALAVFLFIKVLFLILAKNININKIKLIFRTFMYLLIIILIFYNFIGEYFLSYYNYTINRFINPSRGDTLSSNSRLIEIERGVSFLREYPRFLFFGLGFGFTDNSYWYVSQPFWRIHVTYAAMIVENGFLGTLFFILLLYPKFIFKNLRLSYYTKNLDILLPIFISSATIYTLYLLPVMIILFYPLFQFKIENEKTIKTGSFSPKFIDDM